MPLFDSLTTFFDATQGFFDNPSADVDLTADVGSLEIIEQNPTVSTDQMISVGIGGPPTIEITGNAPTFVTGNTSQPGAGSLLITGQIATEHIDQILSPDAGSIEITGLVPTVSINAIMSPGAGAIKYTGLVPMVSMDNKLFPLPSALTLTGQLAGIEANSRWPDTLPTFVLQNNFSDKRHISNAETTLPGKRRTRRRGRNAYTDYNVAIPLTAAQRDTLTAFYRAIGHGSLRFKWNDPVNGSVVNMRFQSPPKVTAVGATDFRATFEVRRVS